MVKKVYISTVGIDPKTKKPNLGPLISGIFSMIPQEIEKVFLLSDREDQDWLAGVYKQFPYLNKKIGLKKIDSFEYESMINAVMEIQAEITDENYKFIVNITGGTKVMTVGTFIGAILIGAEVQYIKQARGMESHPSIFEIKMPKIPINDLHQIQKVILFILKNDAGDEGLIQSEIRRIIIHNYTGNKSNSIGVKKSVSAQKISYHCEILENNGLISREHDETNRRVNILKLTRIGSILSNFILLKEN
ncbi:MAG: hypothetical protein ACTSU9_04555 [Promethearchaeota archaeon]